MTNIRKATASDLAGAALTYQRAFVDDPVMRWFFPDDDDYEANSSAVFRALVGGWIAGATLWCTDDVVACAGWNPPGRPEVETDDDPTPTVQHPEWRIERFLAIRAALEEHTPPEEHWHLNMIATHPDWQRRGLAGLLMREVFVIADEAGLPCYLETETPENVAYYRHHGFEVRAEWDLSAGGETGPHMWGMLRRASG